MTGRETLVENTIVEPGKFEIWLHQNPQAWDDAAAQTVSTRLLGHLQQAWDLSGELQLSFDIFDTLLLRDDRCEEERFLTAAELVCGAGTEEALELFIGRMRGHGLAYKVAHVRDAVPEARLEETLTAALAFTPSVRATVQDLVDAEMELERAALRANPYLTAFFESVKPDKPIWLLSDMYLSPAQITELVGQHFPNLEFRLWVSCDARLSKRAGTLYSEVVRTVSVDPNRCLHFGDNFVSDVQRPKAAGWQAQHLPVPEAHEKRRNDARKAFLRRFDERLGMPLREVC